MFKIRLLQRALAETAKPLGLVLACLLLLPFGLPASAEILAIPADDAPEARPTLADLPQRGSSMTEVESRYGPPTLRHPAIGDPPITRWDYDGFSVFFEYQHVLHSVIPGDPQPIYHKDELHSGY